MTQIAETSKPALAVGCKWGGTEDDPLVLYPEGAMKIHGTSLAILALCDGERTFTDIIEELKRQYFGADPNRIREDATKFLETMQEKRILDY
ncbi:MAG TPA: pyrroloquinoline quinone biosynthesis peptide chaperone PqqD [Terriglobales bacterium]|jgi:pyrroloquinoline quinone biosynthesis protein D|nr:pyrroloquinoline quinone biosynthesis peptide chaperone PqqD [Terriglobales bacterium]